MKSKNNQKQPITHRQSLEKWFKGPYTKNYLENQYNSQFQQQTMSFIKPGQKRITRSYKSLNKLRNRTQRSPGYQSHTVNTLNNSSSEIFAIGCSNCGSRSIDEMSNSEKSESPLRYRSSSALQMIDANNGGFTTIKEYNEKQKVKEGVDVISKKTIFSARYPKKAKILKNGEGPACSVLCYEIIPQQNLQLQQLNYQEWQKLKESNCQNSTAHEYIREKEREIIEKRRREYSNRQKGQRNCVILNYFKGRSCDRINQELFTPIKSQNQQKSSNASPVKKDLKKNRQKGNQVRRSLNRNESQKKVQSALERSIGQQSSKFLNKKYNPVILKRDQGVVNQVKRPRLRRNKPRQKQQSNDASGIVAVVQGYFARKGFKEQQLKSKIQSLCQGHLHRKQFEKDKMFKQKFTAILKGFLTRLEFKKHKRQQSKEQPQDLHFRFSLMDGDNLMIDQQEEQLQNTVIIQSQEDDGRQQSEQINQKELIQAQQEQFLGKQESFKEQQGPIQEKQISIQDYQEPTQEQNAQIQEHQEPIQKQQIQEKLNEEKQDQQVDGNQKIHQEPILSQQVADKITIEQDKIGQKEQSIEEDLEFIEIKQPQKSGKKESKPQEQQKPQVKTYEIQQKGGLKVQKKQPTKRNSSRKTKKTEQAKSNVAKQPDEILQNQQPSEQIENMIQTSFENQDFFPILAYLPKNNQLNETNSQVFQQLYQQYLQSQPQYDQQEGIAVKRFLDNLTDDRVIKALKFMGGFVEYMESRGFDKLVQLIKMQAGQYIPQQQRLHVSHHTRKTNFKFGSSDPQYSTTHTRDYDKKNQQTITQMVMPNNQLSIQDGSPLRQSNSEMKERYKQYSVSFDQNQIGEKKVDLTNSHFTLGSNPNTLQSTAKDSYQNRAFQNNDVKIFRGRQPTVNLGNWKNDYKSTNQVEFANNLSADVGRRNTSLDSKTIKQAHFKLGNYKQDYQTTIKAEFQPKTADIQKSVKKQNQTSIKLGRDQPVVTSLNREQYTKHSLSPTVSFKQNKESHLCLGYEQEKLSPTYQRDFLPQSNFEDSRPIYPSDCISLGRGKSSNWQSSYNQHHSRFDSTPKYQQTKLMDLRKTNLNLGSLEMPKITTQQQAYIQPTQDELLVQRPVQNNKQINWTLGNQAIKYQATSKLYGVGKGQPAQPIWSKVQPDGFVLGSQPQKYQSTNQQDFTYKKPEKLAKVEPQKVSVDFHIDGTDWGTTYKGAYVGVKPVPNHGHFSEIFNKSIAKIS